MRKLFANLLAVGNELFKLPSRQQRRRAAVSEMFIELDDLVVAAVGQRGAVGQADARTRRQVGHDVAVVEVVGCGEDDRGPLAPRPVKGAARRGQHMGR